MKKFEIKKNLNVFKKSGVFFSKYKKLEKNSDFFFKLRRYLKVLKFNYQKKKIEKIEIKFWMFLKNLGFFSEI